MGKQTVGNYYVEKTLGEGAFGKVKLGRHIYSGEKVALKVLEKSRIKDAGDKKRVDREIKIMKLLSHDSIIKLHDVIEEESQIYLVLEFASGGELFDYIVAQERVREKEARKFFRQMVGGVIYCHQLGIIHRDLKPENLLLDENRNIKIIDFGFSNQMKKNSLLKTFCGSPAYAAPEMVAGREYTGPEVDVWSLGVILFALLCGYLPFDHSNLTKLYQQIIKGSFHIPSHVSSGAKHLIKRMLSNPPEKRATLEEVRNHPWMNEGYSSPVAVPTAPPKGIEANKIDPSALAAVAEAGFDPEETRKDLIEGRESDAVACYILMQRQQVKNAKAESKKAAAPVPRSRTNSRPVPRLGALSESTAKPKSLEEGDDEMSDSDEDDISVENRRKEAKAAHRKSTDSLSSSDSKKSHTSRFLEKVDGGPPAPPVAPSTSTEEDAKQKGAVGRRHSFAVGSQQPAPRNTNPLRLALTIEEEGTTTTTTTTTSSPQPTPYVTPTPASLSVDNSPPKTPKTRKRRYSLDAAMSSIGRVLRGKKGSKSGDEDSREPRVIKYHGTYSVSSTSSKEPKEIVLELIRVLRVNDMEFKQTGFTLEAKTKAGIVFEIEVCRLERLAYYGVQLHRISGGWDAYRPVASNFLQQLHL